MFGTFTIVFLCDPVPRYWDFTVKGTCYPIPLFLKFGVAHTGQYLSPGGLGTVLSRFIRLLIFWLSCELYHRCRVRDSAHPDNLASPNEVTHAVLPDSRL